MAGTTKVSLLGFLGFQEESSFAANVTTYDKVLQVRDAVLDLSGVQQQMIARGGVFGRPNQGDFGIPGPFDSVQLTFTMDLYGHGSTTVGSLSQTPLGKIFAQAAGNSVWTSVGDSSLLTAGSDADTVAGADAATVTDGHIMRFGALGDGRAEGQAGVVSSEAGGVIELLTALPGTVNDGDDLGAMGMIYPEDANAHLTSDGSTSNNTVRFVVATGNQQYVLTGCACTGMAFNGLNTAEVPSVQFTFSAAFWADISVTFPSGGAAADFAPAPNAAGSFFIQDVGTTTRVTDKVRNVSFAIDHQMLPTMGTEGANANQVITGWVRGKSMPTLTFDVEAQASTTSPTWSSYWNTDPNSQVYKHCLYTLNPTDGRSVAFYLPRMRPVGPRPTQQDLNGLAYVNVQFEGVEGPTVTSTVTRSPWRIGLG